MEEADILIVGGGAAGISAAKAAFGRGCRSILLVDRRETLGGVLCQCFHRGFGGGLTGTEYIRELTRDFPKEIALMCGATVLSVSDDRTACIAGGKAGEKRVSFRQMVYAAGCREIPAGALPIAGTRPKGIYTAGQMQERMNLRGFVPQGPAVILGSGDLGLIMAAHMAQAGIPVTLAEKNPVCGGLARNQRVLRNPLVSLLCGTTVQSVLGQGEITGVILSDGRTIPCKTLLIAVGLTPERELISGLENRDWLHIRGNCRRVHPMAEAVVKEGAQAGNAAWEKLRETI